jgi:two-component system, OmpR family, phosphate regulon sensor histidine kinase PhoR
MKTFSPRQIAIILGIIASVVSVITGLLSLVLNTSELVILFLLIGLITFFIVYMLIYNSLNNFVLHKIKPIYKTIHDINLSDDDIIMELEERDVMKDVQNDVLSWAKKKTKEIAQLRQLEKYRKEFVGNVSHELKTPIFNIQGYVLTLLDGGLDDKKVNKTYLERTEKSINRLISIVNDLESISRLESGELKLDINKIDIVKLFEDAFEEHERLAKERRVKLKFNKKPEKPVYVEADRKRMMEVINNLLVNSIKYGNKNGSTTVDFLDMDEKILIEIKDNGIGISEKDLPRIFERFFRTDKSRSREMGGTGLGLAIVKHIIEAHDQAINVKSQLNVGTSFTFTLKKV